MLLFPERSHLQGLLRLQRAVRSPEGRQDEPSAVFEYSGKWTTLFRMILSLQGCHEREERAFISAPSASTHKLLEDLLPQSIRSVIHSVLPNALLVAKVSRECIALLKIFDTGVMGIMQVEDAVGSANAQVTQVALAGGHSNHKGNVYFQRQLPVPATWGAVCADDFTRIDADTVCRQLGFARAKEFYGVTAAGRVRGDQFGPVPTPFAILSGVAGTPARGLQCVATDARIQACGGFAAAAAATTPPCPSNQVAGVECAA